MPKSIITGEQNDILGNRRQWIHFLEKMDSLVYVVPNLKLLDHEVTLYYLLLKQDFYIIPVSWIGACQSTYKKGFPCPFCSLTTAPGCNALAALRPLSSFLLGTRPSYLNGSTPSGTFQKKCPGYQRLLVTAYRLP
jgi:hypothetical protein